MLDELRDEGVEIRFSKRLNSFVYENYAGVSVVFSLEVLESTEIWNISAGESLNYFPMFIILGKVFLLGVLFSHQDFLLATGSLQH